MIKDDIAIRSIQHFLYCPHRWGLMEIDCAWAENMFVTKANILHNRVHNPKNTYSLPSKKCFTSVPVFNDDSRYNIYGVTDCLEISGSQMCIVEHKPTKPKDKDFNFDDLMQVFAQKICVDYVFGGDCDGVLYYADKKVRVKLPLKKNFTQYNDILIETLAKMREYRRRGEIPKIGQNQNCNGCSMRDMCMPKIKKSLSVREMIKTVLEKSE